MKRGEGADGDSANDSSSLSIACDFKLVTLFGLGSLMEVKRSPLNFRPGEDSIELCEPERLSNPGVV